MLKRALFSFVVLILILMLSACGAANATPAPTQQPEPETAPPQASLTPPPTTEATPDTLTLIRDAVAERIGGPGGRAYASTFVLLGQPVEGGEAVVFQFEADAQGSTAYCTGFAVTAPPEVNDLTAQCTLERPTTPITAFAFPTPVANMGQGGAAAQVAFGEIYSEEVVAIRVFDVEGGNAPAQISGGGWFATLPPEAAPVEAAAYDADGVELYRGPVELTGP